MAKAQKDALVDLSSFSDHLTIDANTGKLLSVSSNRLLLVGWRSSVFLCQSAGTLQDDEATAKIVYNMLLDANGLLTANGTNEKDAFRSLTVALANSQVVVTVASEKIYCVRKPK
jgi:hypothetical protein